MLRLLPMIPLELSDMVFDFLHDDVATLCSAGLVCKSWVPASRFHLFSEVKFVLGYESCELELELICAEHSTIPPYVLSLEIMGSGETEGETEDEMALRLPLLSNLKTLRLVEINMTILTPVAKKRFISLLQNLTTLDLDYCEFETVNEEIDFIASAPCLEDITILKSVYRSESCNYSSQAIVPSLRRIKFERPVYNIMDWICRCHPPPSVRTLEIRRIDKDNRIPILCKFIRHLGSALENLTISYLDCDWIGEIQNALSEGIDLSQNISLRNISFNGIYMDRRPLRPCGWIIPIISTIAHSSLETVSIAVHVTHVKEMDTLELSALDTLFLNPTLSNNSTKLRFSVSCIAAHRVNKKVVRAALKNGLPKLDGKKRLEWKYVILC